MIIPSSQHFRRYVGTSAGKIQVYFSHLRRTTCRIQSASSGATARPGQRPFDRDRAQTAFRSCVIDRHPMMQLRSNRLGELPPVVQASRSGPERLQRTSAWTVSYALYSCCVRLIQAGFANGLHPSCLRDASALTPLWRQTRLERCAARPTWSTDGPGYCRDDACRARMPPVSDPERMRERPATSTPAGLTPREPAESASDSVYTCAPKPSPAVVSTSGRKPRLLAPLGVTAAVSGQQARLEYRCVRRWYRCQCTVQCD